MVSLSSGLPQCCICTFQIRDPIEPGENVIEVELMDTEDMDPMHMTEILCQIPKNLPTSRRNTIHDHGNTEEMLQLKYKKAIELKSGKQEIQIVFERDYSTIE